MGWLKKAMGFENSFTKNFTKDILKKPTRLLTGIDPLSTKISNKLLGRDDKALVNMLGSPDEQYYERAAAEGVDVSAGRQFHKVADTVAGIYAANGLAGAIGGTAGQAVKAAGSGLIGQGNNELSTEAPKPGLVQNAKDWYANLPDSDKNAVYSALQLTGGKAIGSMFDGWSAAKKLELEQEYLRDAQKRNANSIPVVAFKPPPGGLINSAIGGG